MLINFDFVYVESDHTIDVLLMYILMDAIALQLKYFIIKLY